MAELILAHKLRLREEAVQPSLTQHSCFSLCQQRQPSSFSSLLFSSSLLFFSPSSLPNMNVVTIHIGLGLGLGLGLLGLGPIVFHYSSGLDFHF